MHCLQANAFDELGSRMSPFFSSFFQLNSTCSTLMDFRACLKRSWARTCFCRKKCPYMDPTSSIPWRACMSNYRIGSISTCTWIILREKTNWIAEMIGKMEDRPIGGFSICLTMSQLLHPAWICHQLFEVVPTCQLVSTPPSLASCNRRTWIWRQSLGVLLLVSSPKFVGFFSH